MGCSCKANTSVRKQATRLVRRVGAPTTHSNNSSSQSSKKTVVIRRPAR
jgi:hypothetical protein